MVRKLVFLTFVAALVAQASADNIDDWLKEAMVHLTDLTERVQAEIEITLSDLNNSELYINNTLNDFTTEGNELYQNGTDAISVAVADRTLQAIANSEDAKVFLCISNKENDFMGRINKSYETYIEDLYSYPEDYEQTVGIITDAVSAILDSVHVEFADTEDKLKKCVSKECMDTNLEVAQDEFEKLLQNCNDLYDETIEDKAAFGGECAKRVYDFRGDLYQKRDNGVKAILKC